MKSSFGIVDMISPSLLGPTQNASPFCMIQTKCQHVEKDNKEGALRRDWQGVSISSDLLV